MTISSSPTDPADPVVGASGVVDVLVGGLLDSSSESDMIWAVKLAK